MFYLTYLHRELRRRLGRTILTVLGLAVGVAMVVVVSALSTGLDRAQRDVLDPLESIGTDLIVSRPVEVPVANQGGGTQGSSSAGAALLGGIAPEEVDALVDENQSIFETDLSRFGKPGATFERELFLPATQLTFPQAEAARIARLRGVDTVAGGLSLLAIHQKGTVPEVVASVATGGQTFDVTAKIAPPTQAEWDSIASCIQRSGGGSNCLPGRFQQLRTAFTTPREVIKQVLDPPETDLSTEPYTAAGVDTARPGVGLITEAQIVDGRFFSTGEPGSRQAVLSVGYARRKNLEVGNDIVLNGAPYRVVGLAEPPLGGQAADVYLPLGDLQQLSGRGERVNLLLVRADRAADVGRLTKDIERAFPKAQVTSAGDLADSISGSLVSAGDLADRLGLALAAVALASAVLIAVLLTLSSVAKRIRELGTLAALGWKRALVVRQVVAESFAQGALGGIVGAALGIGIAALVSAAAPTLDASATSGAGPLTSSFGLGRVLADDARETVTLEAPIDPKVVVLAIVLAVAGGLVAGAAGAVRAARLRPADALRELG